MLDIVFGRPWLVRRGRPVALHHLVGHPSVESRVGFPRPLPGILEHLVVDDDPVHLTVRTRHEAVERHVHEEDDLSHAPLLHGFSGARSSRHAQTAMAPARTSTINETRAGSGRPAISNGHRPTTRRRGPNAT